jgi:hypothetical protein
MREKAEGFSGAKRKGSEVLLSPWFCLGSGGWIRTNDLRVMKALQKIFTKTYGKIMNDNNINDVQSLHCRER